MRSICKLSRVFLIVVAAAVLIGYLDGQSFVHAHQLVDQNVTESSFGDAELPAASGHSPSEHDGDNRHCAGSHCHTSAIVLTGLGNLLPLLRTDANGIQIRGQASRSVAPLHRPPIGTHYPALAGQARF